MYHYALVTANTSSLSDIAGYADSIKYTQFGTFQRSWHFKDNEIGNHTHKSHHKAEGSNLIGAIEALKDYLLHGVENEYVLRVKLASPKHP